LQDVQISWRNRNSWRGLARIPDGSYETATAG